MKLWKALVILFCVLLGSGISHAGFLSSDPGLSPGQTLPPGLIIPNPIISNPQLSGLITLVPGSTLWVQGNVQYEPYAVIAGPDGSIWNYNGLSGLASLTMSGVLTFADGSYWDSGGLDTTTSTVLNINGTTNFGPNTVINLSSTSTINLPDGSTWTSAGLNLTKGLSFNGIPMGGVCGAGNFVTALSSTGVITCAVGGGGAGVTVSATAPVSPAIGQLWFDTVGVQTYIWYNDGTSSQWVPVINAGGGASGSGTVTSVGLTGGTTGLTVSGSPVVTSGTMTLAGTLAIASGGTNATTAAAALTNLGAAPLASPSFTGTVNVAALTFNGIAMGGACIAGAFVQSISNSGVPTCGSNLGTSYAPLTNPAGGQNNYAPLASPVFTGTPSLPTGTIGVTQTAGTNNTTLATTAFVAAAGGNYAPLINPTNGQNNYAPLASPTFSGTITFPDGTTATTAGFNTMKALGIGTAAGATGSIQLQVTGNGNYATGGYALNNNAGTSAQVQWAASNGTSYSQIIMAGTGFTADGALVPVDSAAFMTNGSNGMELVSGGTGNPPIRFDVGGANIANVGTNGLNIGQAPGTDSLDITGNGTSSYLISATQNANIAAIVRITNPNAGTQVQNGFTMSTGTGGNVYPTSFVAFGPGWTANPFYPGSTAAIATSEPNGLYIGTNTTPNSINFNIAGLLTAHMDQTGLNVIGNGAYGALAVNGHPVITNEVAFQGSVSGQSGGTCSYSANNGYASRVGNHVTLQLTMTGITCTGMGGWMQIQGFPWVNTSNTNANSYCTIETGNMPFDTNYWPADCRILPGWSGCLPVEIGNNVPAAYYVSSNVPSGQSFNLNMNCNYLVDSMSP
jgi:hypothetical protein